MRVAFVGKGGSGKTTLSALFARHLARSGAPVLAIDGDINQHLAEALAPGTEPVAAPPLAERLTELKDFLRGTNPRIASPEAMIKTTPPGRGSRLLRLLSDDEVHARHVVRVGDVPLMATGEFAESDLGVACYHSKLGAVELYLNHLVDTAGEYVVVDMTAGADAFASGLFTRFDLTFLVAEPTRKGVSVYRQYRDHAREFGIRLAVIGNKVTGEDDLLFLKQKVGDDLLTHLVHSSAVRAAEQGRSEGELEPHNVHALRMLREAVDSCPRDWPTLHRHAVEFHLRNARAWADHATGLDLAAQVDPGYVPGPPALT
ncbi:CO dehydrogenase maturation factor [Streptomyces sp. 3213]|uniref:ATP-binding protein n=1 Tax=Streptomyces sp. 3213.3 TaxID=1855348 RepID=UPI00089B5248|nr:ATP-binding protein [Streptomyces sp. 3213.3]SEE76688.1 CO dehydrogenase maturation factor [Streptomyces sp. 3213] [Streptomyces sp. 3213.3]